MRYLFRIVGRFLTFTFHKVVQRRVSGVVGYLMILSLGYTFSVKSDSERILKIGQHLPKLWAIKYRVVFLCSLLLLVLYTTFIPEMREGLVIVHVDCGTEQLGRESYVNFPVVVSNVNNESAARHDVGHQLNGRAICRM